MLCTLLLLAQLADTQPSPCLARMLEARRSITRAEFLWLKMAGHGLAEGETLFFRSRLASGDQTSAFLGNQEGVTGSQGETGEPVFYHYQYLYDRAGQYWEHEQDALKFERGNAAQATDAMRPFSPLYLGLLPRDNTFAVAGNRNFLDQLLATPFKYTESKDSAGILLSAKDEAQELEIRWTLDPNLNYNPTKVETFSRGKPGLSCETTYSAVGGVYFPATCTIRAPDGRQVDYFEILEAKINDPNLPDKLTPEAIGIEPGMTGHILNPEQDGAEKVMIWGAGKLETLKSFSTALAAGQVSLGPHYREIMAQRQRFTGDQIQQLRDAGMLPTKVRALSQPTSTQATSRPLDELEAYTYEFCTRYELSDEQRNQALSILDRAERARNRYVCLLGLNRKRRTPDVARIRQLEAKRDEILQTELKPRLHQLLTAVQRAAVRE